MNPEGMAEMARFAGFAAEAGYHIRANATLPYIAANPSDVTLTESFGFQKNYGTWDNALANYSWDVLTVQTYVGSTLGADTAAFNQFKNVAGSARTYLYAAWPSRLNFQAEWDASSVNDSGTLSSQSAQYFDNLLSALGGDTHIIPVGAVLSRLNQEIGLGHISALSSIDDLYRDDLHLSLGVGRYVASVTAFSTIYGMSAEGLSVPWMFYNEDGSPSELTIDTGLRDQLASIAWDVVSNDPRTGVAPVPIPAGVWLLLSGLGIIAVVLCSRTAFSIHIWPTDVDRILKLIAGARAVSGSSSPASRALYTTVQEPYGRRQWSWLCGRIPRSPEEGAY
jgi:hypothetical protein